MERHGSLTEAGPELEGTAEEGYNAAADVKNQTSSMRPKILEVGRVESKVRKGVMHHETQWKQRRPATIPPRQASSRFAAVKKFLEPLLDEPSVPPKSLSLKGLKNIFWSGEEGRTGPSCKSHCVQAQRTSFKNANGMPDRNFTWSWRFSDLRVGLPDSWLRYLVSHDFSQEILVSDSRELLGRKSYFGRRIWRAFIREARVEGGMPRARAAPCAPATFQCACTKARSKVSLSTSRRSDLVCKAGAQGVAAFPVSRTCREP